LIAEIRDEDKMREQVMEVVRQHFRPEFLNRIDDIVIFHSLKREDLEKIINIQLMNLQKILDQKHLKMELGQPAREHLAQLGYDPVYGARPLKRTIQQYLQNPLAMELLQGKIKEGDTVKVEFDSQKDRFEFQTKK